MLEVCKPSYSALYGDEKYSKTIWTHLLQPISAKVVTNWLIGNAEVFIRSKSTKMLYRLLLINFAVVQDCRTRPNQEISAYHNLYWFNISSPKHWNAVAISNSPSYSTSLIPKLSLTQQLCSHFSNKQTIPAIPAPGTRYWPAPWRSTIPQISVSGFDIKRSSKERILNEHLKRT